MCLFITLTWVGLQCVIVVFPNHAPGLEVIKLVLNLKLKIKPKGWQLADTCPQAANHCILF